MAYKVNFCDFWPGFEVNNLFLRFMEKYHHISLDKNPDYLFYSVYGNDHLKYKNCIKIFYTGENVVPDFNLCDYALGFHYMDFGDRYLRFPLYVYYQWLYSENLKSKGKNSNNTYNSDNVLLNRKFCNFVYSNNVNSDPLRDKFFYRLSKYKKVDSGGKHLNNIGKPVAYKLEFIKDYKFTIAFENSSVPGYTTEKLLEPLIIKSLPIYYGNPLVDLDFNVNSLIQVKNIDDFDRAIEEIIFLDKNDDIYLEKLKQPMMKNENALKEWEEKLQDFINNIFNQSMSSASRKPMFGYNKFRSDELLLQVELLEKARKNNYYKAKVIAFISKHLPKLRTNIK